MEDDPGEGKAKEIARSEKSDFEAGVAIHVHFRNPVLEAFLVVPVDSAERRVFTDLAVDADFVESADFFAFSLFEITVESRHKFHKGKTIDEHGREGVVESKDKVG